MRFETTQLTVLPSRRVKIEPGALTEETVVSASPDTLFSEHEGQVFVLHRAGEACFVLNRLTARLWRALRHPSRLGDLAQAFASGPAPIEPRDVTEWVGEMASYGLVEVGTSTPATSRLVEVAELRRVAYAQQLAVA